MCIEVSSCYDPGSKDRTQPRSDLHSALFQNAKAMAHLRALPTQQPHPWGSQTTPRSYGQCISSPRTSNKVISSDDNVTQIAAPLYTDVIRADDLAAGKYGAGGAS